LGKLKLIAGGSRASDTMPSGKYRVKCIDAREGQRGHSVQIMLTFEVTEGAWNDGVEIKQWYNLPRSGRISPHTKYSRAWELAAGRHMQTGDDLDPQIFIGKVFQAYVGFSSKGLGNDYDHRHTQEKKDTRDFLRVHELETLISEENHSRHMAPCDTTDTNTKTNTSTNTGVGGGGGGEQSISTNKDKSK